MRRDGFFIVLALSGLAVAGVASASSYTSEARRESIAAALAELRRSPTDARALREAIRDQGRSRCRGTSNALVVRCFLEVGREACGKRGEGCLALADVIVTNHRGEGSFIDDADRYALMNEADNFRDALDIELDRRYAVLAADLALRSESADAAAIDGYCIERARATTLPWQRCVAAMIWFVGNESENAP